MKKLFFVMALLCLFSNVFAQKIDENKINKIKAYIEDLESSKKTKGDISIFENSKEVYGESIGKNRCFYANQCYKTKGFRVGSFTKMITSIITFQLVEEGLLQLKDKLEKYFPEIPEANKITLSHLLEHTSGLKDYVSNGDDNKWLVKPQSHEDIMSVIISDSVSFTPGEDQSYSNSAYYLLANIIEKVSEKSFEKNIKKRIIKPLDLDNTTSALNKKSESYPSYSYENNKWEVVEDFYFPNAKGAGDLISNAEEMNIILEALFDYKLISKKSLEDMTSISPNYLYGKGIMKSSYFDINLFGHGGNTYGTHCRAFHDPNSDISISVINNSGDHSDNERIFNEILKIIYSEEIPSSDELTADLMQKMTGTYSCEELPVKIKMYFENGNLISQVTGQCPVPLASINNLKYEETSLGLTVEFMPEKNQLKIHQGQSFTLTKEETKEEKNNKASVQLTEEIINQIKGTYHKDGFPLDLTIFMKEGKLMVQATGQDAFELDPVNQYKYEKKIYEITLEFIPEKDQVNLLQSGQAFTLTKLDSESSLN
ncbi:serine hydrolase domain-containing protein [Aureibacter tunicatorum]|uniref:D-alanyl-D-alanine carboxypeptidase n=1 Tax=Aureibacter tunicatorum TaxID=866807 RepID=A0AAE3XIJ7_9BACT|nr:serine hydrolase domain-containing protein [Aureibacter tunicatorum]MDR6237363.1 D-alanyl-D-alanine carboxypeptidase [Aureibacter tunicatorum]BDD06354.1 hypothetical protein AUTU_38370 [Aureibacter tunicatorum]